jgi:hypothetical protein
MSMLTPNESIAQPRSALVFERGLERNEKAALPASARTF